MGCDLGKVEIIAMREVRLWEQGDVVGALAAEDRGRYAAAIGSALRSAENEAVVKAYADRKKLTYEDGAYYEVVDGRGGWRETAPLESEEAASVLIPRAVGGCGPSVLRVILANVRSRDVAVGRMVEWMEAFREEAAGSALWLMSWGMSGHGIGAMAAGVGRGALRRVVV
jgi:hypothetical protein